jgi:hypothetical protein
LNRETAVTRFRNTYNGQVSTGNNDVGENTTTANSHRVNSSFDYYLTNRLFLIVPAVEFFTDEFSNIDLRVTPNARVGYEVMKNKYVTWSVTGGAGYQ